jgi:hypothetical protein
MSITPSVSKTPVFRHANEANLRRGHSESFPKTLKRAKFSPFLRRVPCVFRRRSIMQGEAASATGGSVAIQSSTQERGFPAPGQ